MISIIIPTLNEEKEIENTLKKLEVAIKAGVIEVIVSDGRSRDKTAALARKFTPKVIVYNGKTRQTISAGKNLGVKNAVGEFLLFQDADVVYPEPLKFFKRLIAEFKRNPKLVGATVFIKVRPRDETWTDLLMSGFMNYLYLFMNKIMGVGASAGEFQCARAEAFRKIGGFNESLVAAEDHEMFRRLSKVGKVKLLSSFTIFHSGRRAHIIGWPKMLSEWAANYFSSIFRRKAWSKEWKPYR